MHTLHRDKTPKKILIFGFFLDFFGFLDVFLDVFLDFFGFLDVFLDFFWIFLDFWTYFWIFLDFFLDVLYVNFLDLRPNVEMQILLNDIGAKP